MVDRSKRERSSVSYREPTEGDVYLLADPNADTAARKSGRKTAREEPIDAIAIKNAPVPGGPDLTYSIGGEAAAPTQRCLIQRCLCYHARLLRPCHLGLAESLLLVESLLTLGSTARHGGRRRVRR